MEGWKVVAMAACKQDLCTAVIESKSNDIKMEEEFDNFLAKVNEVENLVKELKCDDPHVAERAKMRADLFLRSQGDKDLLDVEHLLQDDGPGSPGSGALFCRKDRTVINQKAFDNFDRSKDPAEMSKEAFMAEVERDAAKRAKDRKERKERADDWKRKANEAFRKHEFEQALNFYTKAIDETRDSYLLYENRALTCLRLDLFRRALDDCDSALRLRENSLKALLYKARALHALSEVKKAEECLKEAEEKHPDQKKTITDYKAFWEEIKTSY